MDKIKIIRINLDEKSKYHDPEQDTTATLAQIIHQIINKVIALKTEMVSITIKHDDVFSSTQEAFDARRHKALAAIKDNTALLDNSIIDKIIFCDKFSLNKQEKCYKIYEKNNEHLAQDSND